MRQALPIRCRPLLSSLSVAVLLLTGGCGGGGGGASGVSGGGRSLGGTVAVGAPMADATVRILDANGDVVASGVSVDASGRFSGVTLSGPAPYRIEACGHAGEVYKCVYSVAQGAGVANVTPLTTAAVLLAANASPDSLMSGANTSLDGSAMSGAQTTLRSSLANVLSGAGVSGSFDFISGDLSAGSRQGYDRVLDAIGVSTGEDDHPFVQITPRMGTGNLYLQSGAAAVGTLSTASGADGVSLAGLETLFANMTTAFSGSSACSNGSTGLVTLMDSNAQMSMGGGTSASGASGVAAALCAFIPSSDGPGWGVTLMSPTLGRCDFSDSSHPVCQVSFVIREASGATHAVGGDMAVRYQGGGVWKFAGSAYPLELHANATAQRDLYLGANGETLDTSYSRALAFDIQAYTGLRCAKVTQKDQDGNEVLVAYYKHHNPADTSIARLSVWRNTSDGSVATNPAPSGSRATRDADDTWLMLGSDTASDDQVRNFFKGGREVTIHLYSDSGCTTPMTIGSSDHYAIDVHGVPPLSAKLPNLPWPSLTSGTFAALHDLSVANGASATFTAAWTFPRGHIGFDEGSFCSQRACGDGSPARIGSGTALAAQRSMSFALSNQSGSNLAADGFKMLALYGRDGDGMMMQANFIYCPSGDLSQCR